MSPEDTGAKQSVSLHISVLSTANENLIQWNMEKKKNPISSLWQILAIIGLYIKLLSTYLGPFAKFNFL